MKGINLLIFTGFCHSSFEIPQGAGQKLNFNLMRWLFP
jgi:hypothetical protein